ncbi:hypothetical protein [Streptomyces sp. F001]|uniref:hypothetical protein n=1 Tax=Streptomyces sp. F001 TaxID=1510026 RepID=UPI001F0EFBC8|nr:hypothetical protein [Streptomyces sp. F001]
MQRDQAVAFGKIVWRLVTTVEHYVELPPAALPRLALPVEPSRADIAAVARDARDAMGVPSGPIPM